VAVFGTLAGVLLSSKAVARASLSDSGATVRQIGDQLMTRYVLPLEVIGLLLTVALIGAVIIAMREPPQPANASPATTAPATHPAAH
jgi:NADH-quinone oxidoreductase subunit J